MWLQSPTPRLPLTIRAAPTIRALLRRLRDLRLLRHLPVIRRSVRRPDAKGLTIPEGTPRIRASTRRTNTTILTTTPTLNQSRMRRSLRHCFLNTTSRPAPATTTSGLQAIGTMPQRAITGCRAHGSQRRTRERSGRRDTGAMIAIVMSSIAAIGVAILGTTAAFHMGLDIRVMAIKAAIGMAIGLITTAQSTT